MKSILDKDVALLQDKIIVKNATTKMVNGVKRATPESLASLLYNMLVEVVKISPSVQELFPSLKVGNYVLTYHNYLEDRILGALYGLDGNYSMLEANQIMGIADDKFGNGVRGVSALHEGYGKLEYLVIEDVKIKSEYKVVNGVKVSGNKTNRDTLHRIKRVVGSVSGLVIEEGDIIFHEASKDYKVKFQTENGFKELYILPLNAVIGVIEDESELQHLDVMYDVSQEESKYIH